VYNKYKDFILNEFEIWE